MKYAFAALLLVACGSTTSTPSTALSDASVIDTSIDAPGAKTFSVTFGPVTVAPGKENTQCVVRRLGNVDKLRVGGIHNVLTTGSHHLIVYRVNDTTEVTTPFDCQPFTDTLDPTKGSPLMITQKQNDMLQLPKGVAYSLDPNQMIRLEMHYINAGSTPKQVGGSSTMIPIADADFRDEADFLFIGNPDIKLPPGAKTTVGPVFFKVPDVYADARFFAITGHEHQLGTNVKVATAMSATDPGKSVYDVPDWKWDEPKTEMQDPPFTIPAGGGFNFSCEYMNTTATEVTFGEATNQEMCFFWAYYYPSHGAKVCIHTAQAPGGKPVDFCCPGSPYCSFFK